MEHGREHEELLRRLLLGEAHASEPLAREQLEACADCRAELERLRALDQRLRAAAASEREDLAHARATAGAEDEARVRGTLLAALAARRAQSRRRVVLLALAAVLLLAASLALRPFLLPERGSAVPEVLLGGSIPCHSPVGPVGVYDVFSWTYELPPQGGHFELELSFLVDGKGGASFRTIHDLGEPRWKPTPEEERALPERLFWRVLAVDDTTGMPLDSGFASAWR